MGHGYKWAAFLMYQFPRWPSPGHWFQWRCVPPSPAGFPWSVCSVCWSLEWIRPPLSHRTTKPMSLMVSVLKDRQQGLRHSWFDTGDRHWIICHLTFKTAGRGNLYVTQPVHAEDLSVCLAVVWEHTGAEFISWGNGPTARILRQKEEEDNLV